MAHFYSMKLDEIRAQIEACQRCPIRASCRGPVPGEGPEGARLMFVGEAPGAEEDLQGKPFVGRSGRLLNRALETAGLTRSDIFVTNVVKCRPPDNRRPLRVEIKACLPHLQEQIRALDPEVILLMGNTPTKALLGVEGIAALRGKVHGDRYLVTYHPAAVVRNPNLLASFLADLLAAGALTSISRL